MYASRPNTDAPLAHGLCWLCLWLCCACGGASGTAGASETSVRPGVNDKYFAPGAVDEWGAIFEGESREVARNRDRIVEALALEPGMVVGDIGAGTGLFTLALARAVVPTGRVYANDIVPEFLERIRKRTAAAELDNVTVVLGTETATKLPAQALDLAFLCNVYHHIEYPKTYLASLRESLKPDGRLVVVDFERIEGKTSHPMLKHVRAGKEVVTREITEAGFRLVEEKHFLEENYFLVFERGVVSRPD